MDPFVEMLLWTTLAGACIPIGAGLAHIEHIRSQWLEQEFRHFVIAFGGGVLVGAVALVLVPEGAERLPEPLAVAGLMLAGGGAFMMIDRIQARAKQATPQFTAMAADFLPESLALGGMFAANPEGGVLLALLIGLQNLPEGFNAWHELATGRLKRRSVLGLMVMLAFLGPVCGLIGWFWLADQDAILGGIMLFASGGILYLMFQDMRRRRALSGTGRRRSAPCWGSRSRSWPRCCSTSRAHTATAREEPCLRGRQPDGRAGFFLVAARQHPGRPSSYRNPLVSRSGVCVASLVAFNDQPTVTTFGRRSPHP